jgi:hypothetical protein
MQSDIENDSPPRMSETQTQPGLSRRSFLRFLSIGAAGAALGLSRTGRALAADKNASVDAEAGQVTLDGLMMTYFRFADNIGPSKFTFGKNFSTTFTLRLPQTPGIMLSGAVPANALPLPAGLSQLPSSLVSNALILLSDFRKAPDGTKDKVSSGEGSGPVRLYGLAAPKLHLSGGGDRLSFYLSNTAQPSFDLDRQVSDATAASMSSQYATLPTALKPPRYSSLDVSAKTGGSTTFDLGLPSNLLSGTVATATVTAKIMKQSGFKSLNLQRALAVGNDLEITYYSVQEFRSKSVMELQASPYSTDLCRVYIDRVFKTFTLAPPPPGAV